MSPKYNTEKKESQKEKNATVRLLDLLESAINEEKALVALSFLPYFKPAKLAKIVGVTRQTIYNWIHEYAPEKLGQSFNGEGGGTE